MTEFKLGQHVRFSDRLVRVSIANYRGRDDLLLRAMELMGISRTRGSRTYDDLGWKMWVPETFARDHLHHGLCMISPLLDLGTDEGFITQRATLQQGGTYQQGWDELPIWMDHGTTSAYKVAFNMHRNPIHVLPEHITITEAK